MFVNKILRKKRSFIYVLFCVAALYLFYAFIRFLSFSLRGHYLTVQLLDVSPIKVYYSELSPLESSFKKTLLTVALLYTESMKTIKWERTSTPKVLQKAGYRVLCIHLPTIPDNEQEPTYPLKGGILADVLKQLNALDSVLVAPSKTGQYALPVVVRGGYSISGFVAISPLDGYQFTKREYQILKTPTLILYGSNDKLSIIVALESLQNIPNKDVIEISGAGRNCYIDKPDAFHRVLLQYLSSSIKKHTQNLA